GFEYLLGVTVDLYLWPDVPDAALAVDQNRLADHAHEFAPIQRLLAPGPVGLEHGLVLVRGEGDRELVLGLELVLRRDRVGRDAQNVGSRAGEGRAQFAEVDRLAGAAGGVRLRIEIEDEIAALEVLQRDRSAAVARQREGRCLVAEADFARHVPSFRRFRPVNVADATCVGGAQRAPRRSAAEPSRAAFPGPAGDGAPG